ncbi:hypothetical protein [Phytoactinopolyspora limicola]|uniref:hypothetical protein n=1 Tax=Phytoactinopolyspora limicola TaxID=2715536 RepID=UPI00140A2343|nr:hypothetical protein [Phytoactinopolyspora limicola]
MHDLYGGGPAVGIDPDALDELITHAGQAAENVEEFVSDFRGRFLANGVSTTNMGQLEQVAEWVRDQLPMLERRRDIASLAAEQQGVSFVTAGAGELAFDTADEAARQAREDASQYMDGVRPGDTIPDEVYQLLMEHNGDPDYVEAFFNAIGGRGVAALRVGALDRDSDDGYDRAKLVPLSYALGTASHRIDFSDPQWIEDYVGHKAPGNTNVIAPLLRYGHFNDNFLHYAMDELEDIPAPTMEDAEAIMLALARHPTAAANWFKDNTRRADMYMQGRSFLMGNADVRAAFTSIMNSATIRARRFDEGLADETTRLLLETVDGWGREHAMTEIQQWFGELIEHHIDDLYDSVTSPAPSYFDDPDGNRPGVEAPPAWWVSLAEEAMRDMDTAAFLSAVFQNQYESNRSRWLGVTDGDNPDANNFSLAQSRYFADWFLTRGENVREQLGIEVDEWNKRMETAIDILFVGADPKGLLKDLSKRGLKAFLQQDKPDYDVDAAWADSLEHSLHFDASDIYSKRRLDDGSLPEVTIDRGNGPITFNGDPSTYEDRHGGRFVADDGSIMSLEEIEEHGGMRAYLEWIQDPAVQNMFWDDFSAQLPSHLTNN